MHVYAISSGCYRKIGIAANVEARMKAMASSSPHPLVIDHAVECPTEYCGRAEYGAHWLLAERWHRGEWFLASAAEAVDAINRAVAWAVSDSQHPYELAGPRPFDKNEEAEWRLRCRAREQAYNRRPRPTPKRQEVATIASQRARAQRKAKRLQEARPLWTDRDYTVDQIAEKVGLSRRTLYNSLGPRWEDAGVQHA